MNQIIDMFFLEGDEFMPNIYLRQHGFTYSVSVPIIKNKEGMQKDLKEL